MSFRYLYNVFRFLDNLSGECEFIGTFETDLRHLEAFELALKFFGLKNEHSIFIRKV